MMSTPDTAPDDRPLTSKDYVGLGRNMALSLLAGRVGAHLGDDWEATGGILRHSDGDLTLVVVSYGYDFDNTNDFHIAYKTPAGRMSDSVHVANMYALPSQIAADLKTTFIPKVQRSHAQARKQQAKLKERNEARKALIQRIAERLDWNSSSFKCHSREPYRSLSPRVGRRRSREAPPVKLQGHVSYADNGTLTVAFGNIPENLADQIVDLVAAHYYEAGIHDHLDEHEDRVDECGTNTESEDAR